MKYRVLIRIVVFDDLMYELTGKHVEFSSIHRAVLSAAALHLQCLSESCVCCLQLVVKAIAGGDATVEVSCYL
jgi:hypothetical protein